MKYLIEVTQEQKIVLANILTVIDEMSYSTQIKLFDFSYTDHHYNLYDILQALKNSEEIEDLEE